jgi:hypothetical protein
MSGQQGGLGHSPHLLQPLLSVLHCFVWHPGGVCVVTSLLCCVHSLAVAEDRGQQVLTLAGGLGAVPHTCHTQACCLPVNKQRGSTAGGEQ